MSGQTPTYLFQFLQDGDIWYPGNDQRNMTTVDHNLAGIYEIIGPGVLNGWDVQALQATNGQVAHDAPIIAERQTLINAAPGSYLARQYSIIGSPAIDDAVAWSQVVRVTPGGGIVGTWQAQTYQNAYFMYPTPGIYYVWADYGFCLVDEGRVSIAFPTNDDITRDTRVVCTYLATVEVAEVAPVGSGVGYVSNILYESKRNQLQDLQGELLQALELSFFHHHHLGPPNHPTKINLASELVLTASGPVGSTILLLYDNGVAFTGDPSAYGFPTVTIDDVVIPSADYLLSLSTGKLSLKNSLVAGSVVLVYLPLAAQVRLTMQSQSQITDASSQTPPRNIPIYLTDGVQVPIDNGDGGSGTIDRVYTWDDALYLAPNVYLDNVLVDPSLYSVLPSEGSIDFYTPLTSPPYTSASLVVILTHIGVEIQGTLSGERVQDLDASTFSKGTLDINRMNGLDHVGLARYKEPAILRPYLRALEYGDRRTLYAESTGADVQYGSTIRKLATSINNLSGNLLIGTKRGIAIGSASTPGTNSFTASWTNDRGQMVGLNDEVLDDTPGDNHFNTTWMLIDSGPDVDGSVVYSKDGGVSWQNLRLPVLDDGTTVNPRCFYATTDRRINNKSLFLINYDYYEMLYLGTDKGFWTAEILEGDGPEDWSWSQADYVSGNINALSVITTRYYSETDSNGVAFITEHYDRSIYLGADQGFFVDGKNVSPLQVTGFYWVRQGDAKNNLFWWSDTQLFFTSTAQYFDISSDDPNGDTTTTQYWTRPLTTMGVIPSTAVCSTTGENIVLSGSQTLDGIAVGSGETVLVKDQTDPTQNGIYVSSGGAWTRSTDNLLGGNVYVDVAQGSTLGGSRWIVSLSSGGTLAYGSTDITFTNYWWRVLSQGDAAFTDMCARLAGTDDFFLCSSSGEDRIWLISLTYSDPSSIYCDTPTYVIKTWDTERQGGPVTMLLAPISSTVEGYGLLVGTDRGIWLSGDIAGTWTRCRSDFTQTRLPTLYDADTGVLLDTTTYASNWACQSFEMFSEEPLDFNCLYEKDYINYYTSPWNPNGADVIVYVNNQVATVPYNTTPNLGLITFASPLSTTDQVSITVLRTGAYITNVGNTPHQEIPNSTIVPVVAATVLAADFKAGDTLVVVQNKNALDPSTTYIELDYNGTSERLNVVIDPITKSITLTSPRQTTRLFPAIVTEVRPVTIGNLLGIEDQISLAMSNQTFHLNSMLMANVMRYALAGRQYAPNLLSNFYGTPVSGTVADRGMKNTFFFDSTSNLIDTANSLDTVTVYLEPTDSDTPTDPRAVTAIGPNVDPYGTNLVVGTDQGLWGYNGDRWSKITSLNDSRVTYFIESTLLGCDNGVFRNSGGNWELDPTYPQATFHHLTFDWFQGSGEAYAKNDGLAFIWVPQNATAFQSDHFDLVDNKKCYYLWKNQFRRLHSDGSGQYDEIDALYICAEDGLYGVTNGNLNRTPAYAAFLGGREMFGTNKPANVKFYRVFQPPKPPNADGSDAGTAVQILVLTSGGIYTVINWRWCDPNDPNGLIFAPQGGVQLAGIPCYCYVTKTVAATGGTPPLSKVFVGTDRGVFRSYNMGGSFEPCERINADKGVLVYDLVTSGDGILAATNEGLFYSEDDGDTWNKPANNGNGVAVYPGEISDAPSFDQNNLTTGALAQEFAPQLGGELFANLSSVSLYLNVIIPEGHPNPTACMANTLTVTLCAVDGNGLPTTTLATSTSTITAGSINYAGFVEFPLSYTISSISDSTRLAIVATETFASGSLSTSVFRWLASGLSNPYVLGVSSELVGGTWTSTTPERDFFFRATFNAPADPYTTTVNIDFTTGIGRGFTVNDSAGLTIDGKVAMLTIIDDSASMNWGDNVPSDRRLHIPAFIDSLFSRTLRSSYQTSFGSIWTFGVESFNNTNGFTNDHPTLDLDAAALFTRGTASDMCDTCLEAISTLSPQGIIDAIFVDDQWSPRVQALVTYLNGKSLLRLSELQDWWSAQPTISRSAWDGNANTIAGYQDVSTHLVTRWASEMSPLFIVFADGDQDGEAAPSDVMSASQSTWDQYGIGAMCVQIGEGGSQGILRTISSNANGKTYVVTDGSYWPELNASFLHGGDNSLFVGTWSKTYDFETPTWIESIESVYSAPEGSMALVQARWSVDRINYSSWTTIVSDVPLLLQQPVLELEYSITLEEGWNLGNGVPITPTVSYLQHNVVTPGRRIIMTLPQTVGGSVFEYILTSIADLPSDVSVNWSIIRGETTELIYGEPIIPSRKGCLPNREHSIQFTPEISKGPFNTTTSDDQTYTVVDTNNQVVTWASTDVVTVYAGGISIPANSGAYSLDGSNGLVIFTNVNPPALVVTVTIVTPSVLYRTYGETTTTKDNRTYTLANGRWAPDAISVVVLVNGTVVRGGYYLLPESGAVVFYQELNPADVVTVYIENSNNFRVVAEILRYGSDDVTLDSFALMCTAKTDPTLGRELIQNAATPTVKNLTLQPQPATVYQRLHIDYQYVTYDGSTERTTLTEWYRYRHGVNASTFTDYEGNFVRIDTANGFPVSYDNRTIVRTADLGPSSLFQQGDQLYVKVAASNGYKTDTFRSSAPAITLLGTHAPYITNAVVSAPNATVVNGVTQVPAGQVITASYQYYDADGGPDQSIVTWYNRDTSTPYYVGVSMPANLVISGASLSFMVQPYDGQTFGVTMQSNDVLVQ